VHAELHGKISPDDERLEDLLTSTVFGTLFMANAWETLLAWLARARPIGASVPLLADASVTNYWFWPRLDDAEPDLVIRAGAALIVVEAKYHSGKSGDGDEHADDQLVREWRACSPQANTSTYAPSLCEAITSCKLELVYLVKRARLGRERRAVEVSAAQLPDARMYLLTWEDLDEVIASHGARWARDLRAYLHRKGLAAFRGFHGIGNPTKSNLAGWSRGGQARVPGLPHAFAPAQLAQLAWLAARAPADHRGLASTGWAGIVEPAAIPRLATLAGLAARFPQPKESHE
jgi:hypothetical protein